KGHYVLVFSFRPRYLTASEFQLPICEVTMSPANATATRRTSSTKTARATILLIEDYSDTRELLTVLLQRRGYEVIEAEDGLEGLLKAGWIYPDLIIMDLSLPEMDGVEATRRIHSQAKLAQIPIFVISAYLTEAVIADVRAA